MAVKLILLLFVSLSIVMLYSARWRQSKLSDYSQEKVKDMKRFASKKLNQYDQIRVIKEVRRAYGLSLIDAKRIVDEVVHGAS